VRWRANARWASRKRNIGHKPRLGRGEETLRDAQALVVAPREEHVVARREKLLYPRDRAFVPEME